MKTRNAAISFDRTYVASAKGDIKPEDYYLETVAWVKDQDNFNGLKRDVQQLHLSGITLVVDEHGGTPQLWARNKAQNIQSLEIVADLLIVRSKWELPGTDITIYVRELRFEPGGQLVTTPVPHATAANPSDGSTKAGDGSAGQDAGDVTIYADTFARPSASAQDPPVFILTGGRGQTPGAGSNKAHEGASAVSLFDPSVKVALAGRYLPGEVTVGLDDAINGGLQYNWVFGTANGYLWTYLQSLKSAAAEPITGLDVYYGDDKRDRRLHWDGGNPGNGTAPTIVAGAPGTGGRGGNLALFCNCLPSSFASLLDGGISGNHVIQGGGAPGKVDGKVTATRKIEIHGDVNWGSTNPPIKLSHTTTNIPAPVAGPYKLGPDAAAPKGPDGKSTTEPAGIGWLHPCHCQVVTQFIDDNYLAGEVETASAWLKVYLSALDNALNPKGVLGRLDETVKNNFSQFATARSELSARAQRIASNLDFFGNPAGWVPVTSLATNLMKFDIQAEDTIRTLFLTEWFEDQRAASAAATDNIDKTISGLAQKREELSTRLQATLDAIPGLVTAASNLDRDLQSAQDELDRMEKLLLQWAGSNVFAQKIVHALLYSGAALCNFIPAGQPVLEMVGGGLKELADFDSSKGFQAAAPQLAGFVAKFASLKIEDKAKDLEQAAAKQPADPSKPDTEDEARKKLQGQAKALSDVAAKLVPLSTELATQAASLKVSDAEVEAELVKLEAQDTAFQTLSQRVRALNESKKTFANELSAALELMADIPAQICQTLLAQDALYQDRVKELNKFSPLTCRFIRNLGSEARRKLLKYQYYMIKCWEYTQLEPYKPVDYRMLKVLGEVRQMLPAAKNPFLEPEQVKTLKKLVTGAESGIQDALGQKLVSGGLGFESLESCSLQGDAIAPLNDFNTTVGRTIILNPMEAGIVSPLLHRVRLVPPKSKPGQSAIHVKNLVLENGVSKGHLTLYVKYFGAGTLRDGANLCAIRQLPDGAPHSKEAMLTWVYNCSLSATPAGVQRSISESGPEADPDLQTLVQSNPKLSNLKTLLSSPPAWTDLEITAEGDLKILSLELEFGLSAYNAPVDNRVLAVRDAHGRCIELEIRTKDGQGKVISETKARTFAYQVFSKGTEIEVAASYLPNEVPVAWSNARTGEVYSSISQFPKPRPSLSPFSGKLDDHLDLVLSFESIGLQPPRSAPFSRSWRTKSLRTAPYYPHTEANGTITKSTHWDPGFRVRYALSYAYSAGTQKMESDLGPWTNWLTSSDSIHPALDVMPATPLTPADWPGRALWRRLYRQFDEKQSPEFVKEFSIDRNYPNFLDPSNPNASGAYFDTMP